MHVASIKTSQIMDCVFNSTREFEYVKFTKKDLCNFIDTDRRSKILDLDVEATLGYLSTWIMDYIVDIMLMKKTILVIYFGQIQLLEWTIHVLGMFWCLIQHTRLTPIRCLLLYLLVSTTITQQQYLSVLW